MLSRAIPLLVDLVSFAEMLSARCRPPEVWRKTLAGILFNVVEPYRDAA